MTDITLYVLSGLSKPFFELWVDRSSTIHASNILQRKMSKSLLALCLHMPSLPKINVVALSAPTKANIKSFRTDCCEGAADGKKETLREHIK